MAVINIAKIFKKRLPSRHKMAVRRFTRSKWGDFINVAFLVAAGLFTMLPLIYAVCTSFKPLDELLIFPPRFFVRRPTLGNYMILPDLMSSLKVPLSRYVFNSVFISVVSTFFYIIIATMAAFVMSKGKFKGRKVLFWIVQFALMFNAYTLAIPRYLIFAKMNIIDTYWVEILPHLASTLGVFLAKQYIDGYIPNALLEAAKIDGASHYRVFWSIVMPVIKPAWLTLIIECFKTLWNSGSSIYIHSEELKTFNYAIQQIVSGGIARSGAGAAAIVVMMAVPIIIFVLNQSQIIETMGSSGMKD